MSVNQIRKEGIMKKRFLSFCLAFMLALSPMSVSATTTSDNDTQTTAGATAESASEVSVEIETETVTGDVTITVESQAEAHASSVEQLADYESIVYSTNNGIEQCFWKPQLEEVPNLEAWVMQNGGYNSAYTGFYDLDNTQPNKLYDYISRECEILGYDSIVSYEYVRDGKYNATLIGEDAMSRQDAIMLIYKALGEYEYTYSITGTSGKNVSVFVSRSNVNQYLERAYQDNIINPYDDNSQPMSGADFILTAVHLMQQYGEPVMNETETNLLLQVYGEEVPIGYGQDLAEAYCYLKARGVLNVDINVLNNITLKDALNICMCIADEDSRTDYKEVQLTYELNQDLVDKGYFMREVTMENPGVEMETIIDYSKAEYYDYFLRIDDTFTGFKTAGGVDVFNVFVSNEVNNNTGQYPGAYTKSKYTDTQGYTYYHFIVPVGYPHNVVTINTVNGTDEPEYINLPRGGGVYIVESKTASTLNWVSQATRIPFDSMQADEWKEFIDADRSGIKQAKALEDYNLFDHMLAAFQPMTVYASDGRMEFNGGLNWSFNANPNSACYSYEFTCYSYYPMPVNLMEDSITEELNDVLDILNNDVDFRTSHSIRSGCTVILGTPTATSGGYKVTITQTPGSGVGRLIFSGDTALWDEAYDKVREQRAIQRQQALQNASEQAQQNYINTNGASISDDTYSTFAICSYRGENAMVSYNTLVERGLFLDGSTPQPDDNGVLVLYSKENAIVKLNQEEHTILVGSTLYKLGDDCALFYYDGADNLMIDFRAAYGWSSHKNTYFKQGSNGRITIDTSSDRFESMDMQMYSYPYIKGAQNQTGYKVLVLNTVSSSYAAGHEKMLLTSAVPNANWIVVNTYNEETGKSEAYMFVYYLAKIWDTGYNGLCSKESIVEDTEEAKELQQKLLGYSVYNGDMWYMRAFNLTNAANNDNPGTVGFNDRSGLYYTLPKMNEYSHVDYLNGDLLLPLYSCIADGEQSKKIINTNINFFETKYGSVYNYKYEQVFDSSGRSTWLYRRYEYKLENISADNPMGIVNESGQQMGPSVTWTQNFNATDLAPSGVFAYFGGFPKEYVSTNDISYNSNITYYLGSLGVRMDGSSTFGGMVNLKYLDTSINVMKSDEMKFYKVATDGTYSTYVFMGNTCNISIDLSKTEDKVLEVVDADSLKQYTDWKNFGMQYLLHKTDEGLTWLIVFIFEVIPLLGMICVVILLGFSFISQMKIVQLFADKVVDPVKILTLGRSNMTSWTFRRGFVFMLIAFTAFALMFSGNIITIIHWCIMQWQGISEIIKYGL